MKHAALVLLILSLLTGNAIGDDWPQWRGPDHNGISSEKGWSTNIQKKWDTWIGPGCSSMSVIGDRVYTMGYNNGRNEMFCLSADDGKPIWRQTYPGGKWANMHEGGPGDTPCVYNGKVYAVSREGKLYSFNAQDGTLISEKDLAGELRVGPPRWGITASAVVIDEQLMIDMGSIVSLNPDTGEINWKTRNFGVAYSTPTPMQVGDKKYLAAFPESGLVILNRLTGKQIAAYDWKTRHGVNAASPVVQGNNIFIASGYNTGCAMLRLNDRQLTPAWQGKMMRNHMASSVLYKNHLYGFDEKVLKCLNARTGKQQWRQRGLGKGALMIADDKLIVLGEGGELLIAGASPRRFKAIQRTQAVSGTTWVAPVLANGKIFCRSNGGNLVCFDAGR